MSDSNAQFVEWLEQNIVARSLINDQLLRQAWEASRQALEVKLPQEEPGYMYYAPDIIGAIKAAGVRVKPCS